MAYTIPESAVSDSVLTTVFWNAQVKDNVSYLYSTVNSTQGSVAATQGSVATINSVLSTTQSLVANTQGSVTATQGSVDNISIQTIATAITSAATAGSVYTLGTADANKILLCYGTASGTVQIPLNATQPFSIGQKVDLAQMGTGTVTVTIASGGTLNYTPSNVLRTKFSAVSVVKMNTNEWLLIGDLA